LNEHVEVLPDGSVAVQVTRVVPTWNNEPDGGEQLSVAPQLSETGTVKVTMAVFFPRSVTVVMFPGQKILGFSVSTTVTVKAQLSTPQVFVALTFTVVVPTGKYVPDDCEYERVGVGLPVDEAVKFTTVPHWPAVFLVLILLGQEITGAVLTVNDPVPEPVHPFESVTVTE
jgi:hypothetical protein